MQSSACFWAVVGYLVRRCAVSAASCAKGTAQRTKCRKIAQACGGGYLLVAWPNSKEKEANE
eukprot:8084277-Alexandrium_andersonii.AAC.1